VILQAAQKLTQNSYKKALGHV